MAESPAHKFGQVIGGLLEAVVQPPLAHFCERHALYLDYHLIVAAPLETLQRIKAHLIEANATQIATFFAALEARFGRSIRRVQIIPLYGRINEFATLDSALQFLDAHPIYEGSGEFRKYEVRVEFSDGDKVEASLKTKQSVREFLNLIAMQ